MTVTYANEHAYTLSRESATPLIGEHSITGTVLRWFRWAVTLCALVLVIDLVCVVLIWEEGTQRLVSIVAAEKALVGLEPNTPAGRAVDASMALAHEWVFAKTGLEDWMLMQRTGVLSAIVNGLWIVIETAVLGLQLFALRVAIVILSLPLFFAVAVVAVADGVYGWLIRRRGGARESGFIYHRAKRAVPAALLLMWAVYVVPPVPMDPRWALPPFAALLSVALRLRVAYFKKHI